jgi:hypothetical protein
MLMGLYRALRDGDPDLETVKLWRETAIELSAPGNRVRTRLRAAQLLRDIEAYRLRVLEQLDRMQRLDGGEPTDRVTLSVQMDRNG